MSLPSPVPRLPGAGAPPVNAQGTRRPRIRDLGPEDREVCLAVFDSNVSRYSRGFEREAFGAYLEDLPDPCLVVEDASGAVLAYGGFALAKGQRRAEELRLGAKPDGP